MVRRGGWLAAGCGAVLASAFWPATAPAAGRALSPPVTLSAGQLHRHMMRALGIEALRPGPSGNPQAPNHANYNEARANPYPNLPDPLTLDDGRKVTSASMWWHQRRPQIVTAFAREVYGRVPAHVPKVTWRTVAVDHERIGFTPVTARKLVGRVDNASYPFVDVNIEMTLVTPDNVKGPVPVLMMFGPSDFPAPNEPSRAQFARIDRAMKHVLIRQDPSLAAVFRAHPAYALARRMPFHPPRLNVDGDPPPDWELVAGGWGFARLDPTSVQADNAEGLTRGIIGLVNKGKPRKPADWGALRAWAWGASRGLDYLQTNPRVDAKRVGIEGVSRYGKAALVTMAFDRRFAMVLVGSSGKGGATLLRRHFGESVANLATGEYYWMAGNFMTYDAARARFGSRNPGDLPVDSHELIALCAPRLTFISYGIPERGDAKWLDQRGSFMATVAADPVFRLLGVKGLGVGGDYRNATMPPVNHGLLSGRLAWRQDDGGHTDAPNVKYFMRWADRFLHYAPQPR